MLAEKKKIELTNKTYIICSIVAIASFLIAYFLPTEAILKGIIALPGVSALFGALWQISREHVHHERQKEIQDREHNFNLSISSHMANVAFDRHVEFCENYIKQVHELLEKSFRSTNTKNIIEPRELITIRKTYATWLTNDINEKLWAFEETLNNPTSNSLIALSSTMQQAMTNSITEIQKILVSAFTGRKVRTETENERKIKKVIYELQKILGINELTQLRMLILNKAMNIDETANK